MSSGKELSVGEVKLDLANLLCNNCVMSGLTAISLFSGAMGLDIGLEKAGFDIKVAVENDPDAVKSIKANRPSLRVIDRDIREVSAEDLLAAANLKKGQVTLIAGGPCCQAFSLAGKRGSMGDPRGSLFMHFLRLVKEINPDYFLIENVKGLVSAAVSHRPLSRRTPAFPPLNADEVHGSAFAMVLSEIAKLGGSASVDVVNSVNVGAPQNRKRLIIVGSPKGLLPPEFLKKTATHSTLGDVLHNFDERDAKVLNISPKQLKYIHLIPPGGNWRNLPEDIQREAIGDGAYKSWGGRSGFLRRLSWDKPCPTLVCNPTSKATMLIHPEENRVLSIGEYKRIQGFPDEWRFHGGITSVYRQIGNAVPIALGEAIGRRIAGRIDNPRMADWQGRGYVACSADFFATMERMKVTTLSPGLSREFGAKAVKEWLGRCGKGLRPTALLRPWEELNGNG